MNIYLDNAASTKIDDRVYDYMIPYLNEFYGNPSSIHQQGKKLKVLVEEARETVADFLGTKPKEILFTSGGTESNNTAIKSSAFSNIKSDRKHIITSSIEHPAVLDSVMYLEKFGYEIDLIHPDKNGNIDYDELSELICDKTLLVSIMHANNELGVVNNVSLIAKLCKKFNALFHCDTVQSVGKIKVRPKEIGLDFLSISAHKIYGPKGIGVLYVGESNKIDKYIHGGGQERDMRGGTENVACIAGLKKTFEILKSEMNDDIVHYKNLKKYFKEQILSSFGDNISFNADVENSLDNIVNVTFNPFNLNVAEGMLPIQLDLKGISVSGGSACSSGSLKPSKILLEIGKSEKEAQSTIRISFGRFNIIEDIDKLISALKEILLP